MACGSCGGAKPVRIIRPKVEPQKLRPLKVGQVKLNPTKSRNITRSNRITKSDIDKHRA